MSPLWFTAAVFGTTALAQTSSSSVRGVAVRLEPGGKPITETPTVILSPTDGSDTLEFTLNDDGVAPDVAKADGRWAGVVMTGSAAFGVSLTVGGDVLDGGTVSWEADSSQRDLVLTLTGNGVTALASSPDGNMPPNGANAPAASVDPASPGAATIPPGASTDPGMPASPTTAAEDGLLWLALGLGALGVVGALLLVLGGRRSPRSGPTLERAPEPPVFGRGTPALHSGLTIWQTDPEEQDRFVTGLVGALARDHRVLLILSDKAGIPSVCGGPVFVCRESDPKRIEDHLADLEEQPGLPVVVVVVHDRPDVGFITELGEMMDPDPGGILLTTTESADRPADIHVVVDGNIATLTTSRGSVKLAETDRGYSLHTS
jgi:hypothetical protein